MKKLHELPRNSPLRVVLVSGEKCDAIFDHLDGMYSYCYLVDSDGEPDRSQGGKGLVLSFHLHRNEEMREVDGRWEIAGQKDVA